MIDRVAGAIAANPLLLKQPSLLATRNARSEDAPSKARFCGLVLVDVSRRRALKNRTYRACIVTRVNTVTIISTYMIHLTHTHRTITEPGTFKVGVFRQNPS